MRPSVRFFAAALFLAPLPAAADAGFVHVAPSLSMARPCDPGASCLFTWTLATRLGDALAYAEERYGARDRSWTLLGVEFASAGAPQIWYPELGRGSDKIVVQLSDDAARDEQQALFQLSHEVIHTLSPAGPNARISVLEEGVATWNSLEYLRSIDLAVGPDYISDSRYEAAYHAVAELARIDPGFANGIRRLRQTDGGLSKVHAQTLMQLWPGISPNLAQRLAAPF